MEPKQVVAWYYYKFIIIFNSIKTENMRTIFAIFVFTLFSTGLYAQENNDAATATVYIIRDTRMMGVLTKFKVFKDNQFVFKLKNHRFTKMVLPTGTYQFSVQMSGRKAKANIDHFELKLAPEETYYLKVETPSSILGSTSFIEITKNSADKILPKLIEQKEPK